MEELPKRNYRGAKSEDFYKWQSDNDQEMNSLLGVQLYLQQTVRKFPSDIEKIITLPEGVDQSVWLFEQLRQFCYELNGLVTYLCQVCLPTTCLTMQSDGAEIYLCAAHKEPKNCIAIDYILHTLEGSASILNNSKLFPSRVNIKPSSLSRLNSACRRLYRIFSHAYFHHRDTFDKFENETHLCSRFTRYSILNNMIPLESLIIPIGIHTVDDKTDIN